MSHIPSVLAELLADCHARGIRMGCAGDGGLAIEGPQHALTPELVARLRAHKLELLAVSKAGNVGAAPDAAALWQAALEQLVGDADFPPDVLEALRAADVRWACDESPEGKPAAGEAPVKPANATCRKCGSTRWRDVPIHEGRSVRRNCVRCGWLFGFPMWHGTIQDIAEHGPQERDYLHKEKVAIQSPHGERHRDITQGPGALRPEPVRGEPGNRDP